MQTSVHGIQFIAANEGFIPHIIDDCGHPCIGHGHDLTPEEFACGVYKDGITEDQANDLLGKDVATVDAILNRQGLSGLINQNQHDALADFTYNLGGGALIQLLAHGIDQVPAQLPRWVRGGGKVLPGLVARRRAEVDLWNTPV
jgi:GH24 family phage-related lysozyme (muramidase)